MRLLIFSGITLLFLASCACVQVPDIEGCTVAGKIEVGGNCAKSNSDKKRKISASELLWMLEPVADSVDPTTGKTLMGRAGAVIISASEYKRMKDASEMACRELGGRCSYEISP